MIIFSCGIAMFGAVVQEISLCERMKIHRNMGLRRIPTLWGQLWLDQIFSISYKARLAIALVILTWHLTHILEVWYTIVGTGFVVAALTAFLILHHSPPTPERAPSLVWLTPWVRVSLFAIYVVPFALMCYRDHFAPEATQGGDVDRWAWLGWTLNVLALPSDLAFATTLPVMILGGK